MWIFKISILFLVISNVLCKNSTVNTIGNFIRKYRESFNASDAIYDKYSNFGLNIYQFLAKYSYSVETHRVETEDGYILQMQRLLSGQNGAFFKTKNKPAVLLMHGLLSSAMDFVNNGPNRSIALMLADAGYDVWLGNNRGTTWSREHKTLDPDIDSQKYYNYSYETCGYYDVPAKLDHIIATTGQEQIFYIGHSQGTSQFFAMAALRPEYNKKIRLMTALAPVGYMKHMSVPFVRAVSPYVDILELIVDLFNLHGLLSHSWIYIEISKLYILITDLIPEAQEIGPLLAFSACGFNNRQFEREFVPILLSNAPAGISAKMFIHYVQEVNSGRFARYDYKLGNMDVYNSIFAPEYNFSAITAPVAFYYSENDYWAAVEDVELLASKLPNLVKLRLIEERRFNHLDFVFAKDVHTILNDDLIATQNKYIPSEQPKISSANTIFGRTLWCTVTSMLFAILFIY